MLVVIDKKQMSLWLRIKANCDSFGRKDEGRLKISIHQSFIRLNLCILFEAIIAFLSNSFEIGAMYIILNSLTLPSKAKYAYIEVPNSTFNSHHSVNLN